MWNFSFGFVACCGVKFIRLELSSSSVIIFESLISLHQFYSCSCFGCGSFFNWSSSQNLQNVTVEKVHWLVIRDFRNLFTQILIVSAFVLKLLTVVRLFNQSIAQWWWKLLNNVEAYHIFNNSATSSQEHLIQTIFLNISLIVVFSKDRRL